jgi:hypothetical protein
LPLSIFGLRCAFADDHHYQFVINTGQPVRPAHLHGSVLATGSMDQNRCLMKGKTHGVLLAGGGCVVRHAGAGGGVGLRRDDWRRRIYPWRLLIAGTMAKSAHSGLSGVHYPFR